MIKSKDSVDNRQTEGSAGHASDLIFALKW
jgi:hypothetical protein